jgi:hypothetical protein
VTASTRPSDSASQPTTCKLVTPSPSVAFLTFCSWTFPEFFPNNQIKFVLLWFSAQFSNSSIDFLIILRLMTTFWSRITNLVQNCSNTNCKEYE